MGWTNSHLYEIPRRATSDGACPIPTPIGAMARSTPARPASATSLEDLGTKTLRYLYDFGDGWEHTVKVERVTRSRARRRPHPALDPAVGRRPPEDVG